MARNLVDLPPYIPLKGVNLDEDSLLIDQAMCMGIRNLRIEGHQLSYRPALLQYGTDSDQTEDVGLIISSTPDPAVTPIVLTAHSLAGIGIETGSLYLTWTDATVLWEMTDDGAGNVEDADLNTIGSIDYGTGIITITQWPASGLLQYSPSGGTNAIIYARVGTAGVEQYPFDADRALKMMLFRDPEQDVVQFYFLGNDIVKYNAALDGYTSILDPAVSFTGVTLWSAVQFTDTDIGATMVAAGTMPPDSAMGDETDGADRVLLYYDKDSGTFKDLIQWQEIDESSGVVIESGANWAIAPLVVTASLLPVKSASMEVYFADDDYTWTLTTNASDEVLDPDDNVIGSIVLNTGVVTINVMPKRSAGVVTYTPVDNNTPADVWMDYEAVIDKKPRFVFNMNNRIVMVNIYNQEWTGAAFGEGEYQPWRVRWTKLLDVFHQEIASDYTDNVGGDISPYVGGEHMGDLLILYRINSIEQMFYVGGDNVFSFRTSQNNGVYAGQAVARYERIHFYYGKDNIYIYDGNTSKPIGTRRVINYIQSVADEDKINRFLGFVDPVQQEYWFMPVQTTDTNSPIQAFVYGMKTDSWTVYEFPKEVTYISFLTEYSTEPIMATYDGYLAKITESLHADRFMAYDATAEGHIFVDTPIDGELITRDIVINPINNLDRIERMVFEAQSDNDADRTVNVKYSTNYGNTWSAGQDKALDSNLEEREFWLDSTQKHIRFKFEFSNYFVLRYMYASGLRRDRDSKEEN